MEGDGKIWFDINLYTSFPPIFELPVYGFAIVSPFIRLMELKAFFRMDQLRISFDLTNE